MPTQRPFPGEYRASNGLFYKATGNGDPLLLLHGLMATGAMFDQAPSADPHHSYSAPTPTEAPPVASMAPFAFNCL
jgi:hypothetical protein